jgi:PAS domain S-box-containing protein
LTSPSAGDEDERGTEGNEGFVDRAELTGALFDSSPDGILLVEPDGSISQANPAALSLFGHDELVGKKVEDLVPAEQRLTHARHRQRYVADASRRPMGTGLRLFAENARGAMFPVEISLSPVELGDRVCTIATVRDVSERQEVEANLALLRDRERIARDLHDMVIQRLFAAGMSLQAVIPEVTSPIVSERIRVTIEELDETIRELRTAIFQLGEHEVRVTVPSRVAELIDERKRQLGFEPALRIRGTIDDLPNHVADQLLATVSEALSNVARHAGATRASVDITRNDREIELTVTDDGSGIAPRPSRGSGLTNMMWRAAELGGTCTIGAAETRGTIVSWRVPLPQGQVARSRMARPA